MLSNSIKIMGILNITDDSFYAGSRYSNSDFAIKKASEMQEEGAAIIDVGGESSRPGSEVISVQLELDRVIPVIEKLRQAISIPISIDTYKPQIMREAIRAGATIVNDIKALREEGALQVIAETNVQICLMHMQGEPKTMQQNPHYENVVQEVSSFLAKRVQTCVNAGIAKAKIIIDPGFGFGKTMQHNLQLLKNLDALQTIGCSILVGLSRKSSIGAILNKPVEERLYASLAAAVIAAQKGAKIIRTHDVAPTVEAIAIAQHVL